jgi:4-diphosphocytidyl-2-C-methyl-D-erythritol kinase
MKTVVEKAFAKINLSIDVTGIRDDGYHLLRMITQSIRLHDTVIIEKCGDGIEVICDSEGVPADGRNTAYRAAASLLKRYNIRDGLRIIIQKRIPVAAGLAGGSTDAAAVYRGLNRLFSLGLSNVELANISVETGADVPFCIIGGTALVEGIGEKVTPVKPLVRHEVVLVNPGIPVSTAEVYGRFRIDMVSKRPDIELLLEAVERGDIRTVASNMVNVLETVTLKMHGVIGDIKKELLELGAMGSAMSGSGAMVFGIFDDSGCAEKACHCLGLKGYECILTQMGCMGE